MFRRIAIGIFLIAAASFNGSLVAQASSYAETICPMQGKLAGYIMDARQYGVLMSEKLADYPEEDNPVHQIAKKLVYVAYNEPIWRSEQRKEQAIHDFRDATEVQCFRQLG